MKAVLWERYGPPEVLRVGELPRPEPKNDEILIRVHAASVTLGDCELRAMKLAPWVSWMVRLAFGVIRPRKPVPGAECAGEVVAVGSGVDKFSAGDRVFGTTGFALGSYAQYKTAKANAALASVPDNLDYAEVVGIPIGGFNGLHFVRIADVKAGEHVVINGAGGAIGTFAVQLAKLRGATVTAVDRGDKLDMLTGIGADHVIDYQQRDFTGDGPYDVVIDVVGKADFNACMAALKPEGRLVLGNPQFMQMMRGIAANRRRARRGGRRVLFNLAGEPMADLEALRTMVADGTIKMVIDRHFALEDIVAAHRYVEAGNKKGIVVIDVPQERAG